MTPQWGRAYMTCSRHDCTNWIWTDRVKPNTKCRRCGNWWPAATGGAGKGKGSGRPTSKAKQPWLETPPGLGRVKPLKKSRVQQQEATHLLATSWTTLPAETQNRLQALGIGPAKPEEPELTDILKSHMESLPTQVQKLTAPEPCTEKDIAMKLKGQVTELKTLSIRKSQLQDKIDGVKAQYTTLLADMQTLQGKLAEGQKALQQLSQDYMKAVNQTPTPAELTGTLPEPEQIPMAVESFVHNLGIALTEEQKTQLHGLLKRSGSDTEDPTKRRKTDGPAPLAPGHCG